MRITDYNLESDGTLILYIGTKKHNTYYNVDSLAQAHLIVEDENIALWMKDGNADKIGEDLYIEQTTQWNRAFTLVQLIEFYNKEFTNQ